ncbi:hypothetical protein NZ698_09555 [Chryseobacterium sp. PBS4-4]|uniref:PBCV-specific basic adaptor domain-containing protein n=1 Tax=Chryseobacterium edaphi TaxID=2976532 RepID=A0ABT2W5F0_9FLAO|nr:hypothetical protein [Chryseobacterium edaphi]MCU7617443.1 hypothetical protein [Chryseobacterium edaphi]
MKKLLFTSLLGLGLLLPATIFASTNNTTSTTEMSFSKGKKKKSKKSRTRKSTSSKSRGCTFNGHTLYVGKRGGCYYMAGSSKEYVDRSYCSGCN